MSHNIHIIGYGSYPWQTPTYLTRYVLDNAKGNSPIEKDLSALKLLEEWVQKEIYPPPLKGKDSKNPYLLKLRENEIKSINNYLIDIENYIRKTQSPKQLVVSN